MKEPIRAMTDREFRLATLRLAVDIKRLDALAQDTFLIARNIEKHCQTSDRAVTSAEVTSETQEQPIDAAPIGGDAGAGAGKPQNPGDDNTPTTIPSLRQASGSKG
jgi:hypothetical protein